ASARGAPQFSPLVRAGEASRTVFSAVEPALSPGGFGTRSLRTSNSNVFDRDLSSPPPVPTCRFCTRGLLRASESVPPASRLQAHVWWCHPESPWFWRGEGSAVPFRNAFATATPPLRPPVPLPLSASTGTFHTSCRATTTPSGRSSIALTTSCWPQSGPQKE